MTSLTTFPKPKWALTIWALPDAIVVEMPTGDPDNPYYIKYPLTEGGLQKALKLLKVQRDECNRKGPRVVANKHGTLSTKKPIKKPITAGTTQANRDKVRELLKKRGLI